MAEDALPKLAQAKITSRMQITLPVKVQKELGGVKPGEFVIFYKDGKDIMVKAGLVESKDRIL